MSQSLKRTRTLKSSSSSNSRDEDVKRSESRKIRRVTAAATDVDADTTTALRPYNCYSSLDYRSVPYCLPASQEVKGREIRGRYPDLQTCQNKCQAALPGRIGREILSFLAPRDEDDDKDFKSELDIAREAGYKKGRKTVDEFEQEKKEILDRYANALNQQDKDERTQQICDMVKRNYGLPYANEINKKILRYDHSKKQLNCVLNNPKWPITDTDWIKGKFTFMLADRDKNAADVIERMYTRGLFDFNNPVDLDKLAIEALVGGEDLKSYVIRGLLKHQANIKQDYPFVRGHFMNKLAREFFNFWTPDELPNEDRDEEQDDDGYTDMTKVRYNRLVKNATQRLLLISELLDEDIIGPIDFGGATHMHEGPHFLEEFARDILTLLESMPSVDANTMRNIEAFIYLANNNLSRSEWLKDKLQESADIYRAEHPIRRVDYLTHTPKKTKYSRYYGSYAYDLG